MMKPLAKERAGLGYVRRAEGPHGATEAPGEPLRRRVPGEGGAPQAACPEGPRPRLLPQAPPQTPLHSPLPRPPSPHYPLFLGLGQQHPLPTLLLLHLLLHEGPTPRAAASGTAVWRGGLVHRHRAGAP